MKIAFCDSCAERIAEPKPEGVYQNLNLLMGVYDIEITITESQEPREFCRACRTEIVSDALLQPDRYSGLILPGDNETTANKKRRERKTMVSRAKKDA